MTSVIGRSRLFFGFVGLISMASMEASAAPLISLKAVEFNGGTITPTNTISVEPGDVITAEIFVTDWSPFKIQRLVAYQTGISRNSLVSGTRGSVLPIGWDAPITISEAIGCSQPGDPPCPAEFPVCAGFCVGLTHDPTLGVFIGDPASPGLPTRPDWVFHDPGSFPSESFDGFSAVDTAASSLRYAATLFPISNALPYIAPPRYCGTLKLVVSDDACGRFNLRLLAGDTVLTNQDLLPMPGVLRQGLIISVTSPGATPGSGECSCLNIVRRRYDGVDVTSCTIDARQPFDPDVGTPQIPNSVTFTFDCANTTDIANAGAFTRTFDPIAFFPGIGAVTSNGSDVTVALAGSMLEMKWNCITFNDTGGGACIGIMPGDANADARSLSFDCGGTGEPSCPSAAGGGIGLNDITALVDCMNNPGTCATFRCDINHSGACGPQDLLREIDVLQGTGFVQPYNGKGIVNFVQQLVACPLAP